MRSKTFLGAITLVAAFAGTNSYAGGSFGVTEIPRSYGPFKLGMTASEFSRITGVSPNACPICIDKENFATLSGSQMKKHVPGERNPNGVDFFFLNNELYQISLTPSNNEAMTVKEQIAQRFSADASVHDEPNGMSVAKWEDESTVFSLNFSDANNEVFSMNLTDWNLSQERAWRESILLNQTAKLN